jgi:hypothetical protein
MIGTSRLIAALVAALAIAASNSMPARGYALLDQKWPNGTITMHLELGSGSPSGGWIDGSTSWNQVATNGLAAWNPHIQLATFSAVPNSTAPDADGNRVNTVTFNSTIFGEAFGSNTLAVTTNWYRVSDNARLESDIVFNTAFTWNSYRGGRRSGIVDFLRVMIHEAGHSLGLDHPDEKGQNVTAIMNSRVSDVDSLQTDDINGARALYGAGVTSNVAFPPRNETADFIVRLIALYRDELRAPEVTTYVDAEGAGVWVPDYTRYRVGQCNHPTAQERVFLQITSSIVYGVCALTPSGPIVFPPRNEGLQFMIALNALYRDTLRRSAGTSFVDNEGIVVWVMEYLRYRLNGCGHADATNKVFMQIRGQGIQPVCTA